MKQIIIITTIMCGSLNAFSQDSCFCLEDTTVSHILSKLHALHIKGHQQKDMIIMSWPDMDSTAVDSLEEIVNQMNLLHVTLKESSDSTRFRYAKEARAQIDDDENCIISFWNIISSRKRRTVDKFIKTEKKHLLEEIANAEPPIRVSSG